VGLDGATVPSLILLVFPVSSALVAGVLYWGRARADAAKLEPWRKWGAFLSISCCGGLLLTQLVVIIRSFHVDLPLPLWAIGRALPVMMMIMWLLAINQMPKLPYFERRLRIGGELGPIYGPRFTRAKSRVAALLIIATIAGILAATPGATPGMPWRLLLFIFVATVCLMAWAITWRLHLARKWKREQSAESGPA
jgi:hypothetical protein